LISILSYCLVKLFVKMPDLGLGDVTCPCIVIHQGHAAQGTSHIACVFRLLTLSQLFWLNKGDMPWATNT